MPDNTTKICWAATITAPVCLLLVWLGSANLSNSWLNGFLIIVCAANLFLLRKAQQNHAAEKEINSLRSSLSKLREQYEETLTVKERFLANMSHEIRTPMNGVFGMTDLLEDTRLSRLQQRYVRTIRQSLESLLNVTNDVLDFSKIQQGAIRLEHTHFRLDLMIEDVCELHAHNAQKKGLELNCDVNSVNGISVNTDQARLRQILNNLISNAIKFTPAGEIKVSAIKAEDDQFCFTVTDTGIGISSTQQEQIFKAFYQGDSSTTRRFEGTGLGLTISNNLIKLLGGQLNLQSEIGKGSEFRFSCNIEQVESAEIPYGNVLTGLRVLVVDDNRTNSEILHHQLKQWGIVVSIADSGPEALQMLNEATGVESRYQLAILDFHMPGMDGFELARHIQNLPVYSSIPLMMLTSSLSNADDKDLSAMGIAFSLTKPARQSALYNALIQIASTFDSAPSPQATMPTSGQNRKFC